MFYNMLKSILCLSLLATPLLAQPRSFKPLTKRADTLSLDIYIDKIDFPSDEDLKAIKCTTAYPPGAKPVQVATSYRAFDGSTFELGTSTAIVFAYILTRVPLRVDEGTRTFQIEGLGKGKDLNVSHKRIIPHEIVNLILVV